MLALETKSSFRIPKVTELRMMMLMIESLIYCLPMRLQDCQEKLKLMSSLITATTYWTVREASNSVETLSVFPFQL